MLGMRSLIVPKINLIEASAGRIQVFGTYHPQEFMTRSNRCDC